MIVGEVVTMVIYGYALLILRQTFSYSVIWDWGFFLKVRPCRRLQCGQLTVETGEEKSCVCFARAFYSVHSS